jgi:formylglycine-generating enzyme required for sulfatase activity
VVEVTWEDAASYCNWLSAKDSLQPAYVESNGTLKAAVPMTDGYRLPTEAEWAWVARYEGGETAKKYAWGDSLPVAASSGNYADDAATGTLPSTISGYNDTYAATAPVDSFQANRLGIFQLGGNVAEWAHDHYSIYSSNTTSIDQDPMGPPEGEYHVIRGSSWMDSTITELRLSYRDYGNKPRSDLGFRIARYSDQAKEAP